MSIFQLQRVGLCMLTVVLAASSGIAERPRVYCIEGATVVTEPGRQISPGSVVLRDGLIEAVGADIEVPADAVRIDGAGLWVYPGLIDTAVSLSESGGNGGGSPGQHSTRSSGGEPPKTAPGPVHPLSLVHPERRASDELLPFEGERLRQAERLRRLGFTTVLAVPGAGVFRGSSAAVLLKDERPVAEIIFQDNVAQHISFESGGGARSYPASLMGTVATIRQVILDAQRQAEWSLRYEANPQGMKRPENVAAFEALRDVVEHRQPVIFHTSSPDDVLLANRLADEFDLDAAIFASGHEWEIATQLGEIKRTIILPVAFPDKPKVEDDDDEAIEVSIRTMERYLKAPTTAARLEDESIQFALSTSGLKTLSDFKQNLAKMIDEGLTEERALAALTTVPAALLGIDRTNGTLAPGKLANVVVFDGPIFADDSVVRHIFVDGVEYLVEEKKKPKGGDPNAVVDPRGEWAVRFESPEGGAERKWEIKGAPGSFSGTAETRSGTVAFDDIRLEGNMLTVIFPGRGGRGPFDLTVVISGDAFEGSAEFGPRTMPVKGTRTSGPEGGER